MAWTEGQSKHLRGLTKALCGLLPSWTYELNPKEITSGISFLLSNTYDWLLLNLLLLHLFPASIHFLMFF